MRMLAIGYPLPNSAIDNYNPFTAPSYFDYDALFIDPISITRVAGDLLSGKENYSAHDGRDVVNGATTASTVSAADQLKRRADETERFLSAGGVMIVVARPNALQPGIVGFEGCDRYSWLPAPAGLAWGPPYLRAAEGKTIRIVADDHPAASLLRDYRSRMAYRAVFDDRQPLLRQEGHVIAAGGAGAPIAVEFRVLAGRVLFVPSLSEEVGSFRAELATSIVDVARQLTRDEQWVSEPYWASNYPLPGLAEVEAELAAAKAAADEAAAKMVAAQERRTTLVAYRRLISEDGPPFVAAVRDAFALLGFAVHPTDSLSGFAVESEGQAAFVECEGSRGQVVEWPYVRLQRRLEKRMLEGGDQPKGIVVVNGHRLSAPEERGPQFADTLRLACENYRYALVTGETLFAAVLRALEGAGEAELTGIRRRLLAASGEFPKERLLGTVDEEPKAPEPFF